MLYAWTIAGYLLTSPVRMIAKGAGEVNRGKMGMQAEVKKQRRFMNSPYFPNTRLKISSTCFKYRSTLKIR